MAFRTLGNAVFLSMRNTLLFLASLLFLLVGVFSFTENDIEPSSFEQGKEKIILRKIGHEVLLAAGNSTARVLPIKEVKEGVHQISFESELFIDPDTLKNIVDANIARYEFSKDYLVNVLDCAHEKINYGYAVLSSSPNDILACSGRRLPVACYLVELEFLSVDETAPPARNKIGLAALFMATLAFILGLWRTRAKGKNAASEQSTAVAEPAKLPIGKHELFPKEQYLIIQQEKIQLTEKEARILEILALQANQVVQRAELQEEIWGDGGMMVSRSLDMFISKLRKKIKAAEDLEIVNIRGKGWVLKIV